MQVKYEVKESPLGARGLFVAKGALSPKVDAKLRMLKGWTRTKRKTRRGRKGRKKREEPYLKALTKLFKKASPTDSHVDYLDVAGLILDFALWRTHDFAHGFAPTSSCITVIPW
jgi:hypothetical protein